MHFGKTKRMKFKNYLTISQFAWALSLHPDTVRRWAKAGKIKYSRTPGKHRRFSTRELNKIINGTKTIA